LRFNTDGSIERTFDLHQFFADNPVCAGITGLLVRPDGSLLVGDDAGISAFVGDSALQTFGVDGGAADEYWYPWAGCTGLRSFAATPSGELLTVSVASVRDGQRGFRNFHWHRRARLRTFPRAAVRRPPGRRALRPTRSFPLCRALRHRRICT